VHANEVIFYGTWRAYMENIIAMLNIDEGYTYLRMTEDGLNFSRLCCWDTLRGRHFHVQEIK